MPANKTSTVKKSINSNRKSSSIGNNININKGGAKTISNKKTPTITTISSTTTS